MRVIFSLGLALAASAPARAQSSSRTVLGPNCELISRDNSVGSGRIGLLAAMGQIWVDSDNRKACEKRIAAESASVVQRLRAQWDLFLPRARMVMQAGADSLGLRDSTFAAYWRESADVMQNLWIVDQEASTSHMREVLEPVKDRFRRKQAAFSDRAVRVFSQAIDTLPFPAPALNALKDALNARLIVLMGENLDASDADILRRMAPVFDSAGVAWKKP